MTPVQVAAVLVRLTSVIIVVLALQSLVNYPIAFVTQKEIFLHLVVTMAFLVLVPCGIAAMLWFFPMTVIRAERFEAQSTSAEKVSANLLLSVGIALIAIYSIAFGIIDLAYFEAYHIRSNIILDRQDSDLMGLSDRIRLSPEVFAGRISSTLQIVFGIVLLFGRRSVMRVVKKLKFGGVSASS